MNLIILTQKDINYNYRITGFLLKLYYKIIYLLPYEMNPFLSLYNNKYEHISSIIK
jgi:hypothetical protein